MPKNFLTEILDEFAKLTSIIVVASNIKEDLDHSQENKELLDILNRTKEQVDNLIDHSKQIETYFCENYEKYLLEVNPSVPTLENDILNTTSEIVKKPLIKLVDINTLVDPKLQKKSVNDESVVIITSSDEEVTKKTTVKLKVTRLRPRIQNKSPEQFKKTNPSTSSLPTSNSVTVRRISLRKKNNDHDKIQLKESDSESESDDETSSESLSSTKKTKSKTTEPQSENNLPILDFKNDKKLQSKCHVKLLAVPCEKLKEYYLKKMDILEINKLCDSNLSKRKRHNSSSSSDDKTSQTSSNNKKIVNEKKKKKNGTIGSSSSSESDGNSETLSINPEKQISPDLLDRNVNQEMADDAMNMLQSDSDENTKDKDEHPEQLQKEQEPKQPEEVQTNSKNESKTKENNTESDENNSDNSKTSKKVKTSKWKKDKLLTEKLSSTDSEEGFQNFQKKKNKMVEAMTRLVKKRVKKAILSDSDSDGNKKEKDKDSDTSISSSSKSEDESEKQERSEKTKPRRRVKRVQNSSSDDDEEKSTRKQIRNIWGRDSLAETTRKAEDDEKQRKARITEKQKKYNQIYDNDKRQSESVDKLVLDFDEINNKALLTVSEELVQKLKPHQASGVQFMWDACFESLDRAKTTQGSGCILAHCMGLGKTLQVIALSHTLLTNYEETKVKKVLVVSPLNTVLNWVNEFKQWLPDNEDYEVYELVSFKQNFERQYQVKTWHTHGGVLIIGYDMFRNLSNPKHQKLSKKLRACFAEALVDPGPDLVICDEGHLLKNEKTNLSIAMNRIKTLRRIVLTGTPLQNNLKEYFCMVQFIKPNLLGTYKEYLNRFVNPITNGQYTDSTLHDTQIMRKRSHVLHKMLDGVVQRRDYSVLEPYLKPKFEYVLFLKLTETQIKLYRHYLENFARKADSSHKTSFLFIDFQSLQRICTHPRVLLDKSNEMKLKEKDDDSDDTEGSLKDFIDDDEDETSSSSGSSSDCSNQKNSEKKSGNKARLTRAALAAAKENGESLNPGLTVEHFDGKEWWQEYCDGDELNVIKHSSKLFLLFEILKECEAIGDKVLVFSQSLYSLNIIEYFLGRIHDATQNGDSESVGGYSGSWCIGLDYFRLDGSSSCDNRNIWCKAFNRPSNTRARLFLISTRAGGLGINLVAANRVIIFDVSWNPSHDIQSIYRVYRFGQTKPSYIYRFVTQGTMEMKVYERQVTKQAISKRVIDEQQIDRHYNQNDLAELYKFDPDPGERPIPLVPKDILLGELLQKHDDRVYKYHEHQSLLENKHEECLNEEERKAAWEEFENEKKQRTHIGNSFAKPDNLEIAFMRILRRENPVWSDKQIKSMIPILHNQMQEQISRGDLTMYKRVQQEIQIVQTLHIERYRQELLRQQLKQQLQQQYNNAGGNSFMVSNPFNFTAGMFNTMPSTSQNNPTGQSHSEVIELND